MHGFSFLAAVAAILLALAPARPAAAQQACPTPPEQPVPQPPSTLAAALNELNQFRAANGVPAVSLNAKLTVVAQAHADDMAAKGYFSHTGRDGSNAGQRITRTGYVWQTWGENIAMGYQDWSAALSGWKNSSGHRRNMLNASFKHVGLGVRDRRYVQVFAAPR